MSHLTLDYFPYSIYIKTMTNLEVLGVVVWIVKVLAMAGLGISGYFTLLYYRILDPNKAGLAIFCQIGSAHTGQNGTKTPNCTSIVHTPYARLFGVPNSLLGLGWFGLVALAPSAWFTLMMWPALATVAVGGLLVWAIRFKLSTHCAMCYTSHALNVILFLLFALKSAIL